jgi:hypothetical protein
MLEGKRMNGAPDRRQFVRVPLDAPYFVTLSFDGGITENTLLVDIGRGGLQVSFGPARAIRQETLLGSAVCVGALPAALKLPLAEKDLPGIISWVSPQRCGVRFHTPLSLNETELAIALAAL